MMLMNSGSCTPVSAMMAAITMLSIAGLVLYAIIAVAEGWTVYWQGPAEVGGGGG